MRILVTMKRSPAGVVTIPLLLGCAMSISFPNAFTIDGFTSSLFENGVPTLIGPFLSCSGTTINIKVVGSIVRKGAVLTALKFFIGSGLELLFSALFGEAGFLGLAPLAVIGAAVSSSGVIYVTLVSEFNNEIDAGVALTLALNDDPLLTMVALGASGMGNFPIMDTTASIVPTVIEFIIGNLDHEWRKILATGMALLPPFNSSALDAGMNFDNIFGAGIFGILLDLLTVLAIDFLTFFLYSALRKKADPMGATIGTTTGVVTIVPTAVITADPSLRPQMETTTAQITTIVIITAMFCPLLVFWLARVPRKRNEVYGMIIDTLAFERGSCEAQPAVTVDLDSL